MDNKNYITVQNLFEDNKEILSLSLVAGFNGMKRNILNDYINRPAFVLIGYSEFFPKNSVQILGNREINFLKKLAKEERNMAIENLFSFDFPCMIIARGYRPFKRMKEICNTHEIPLFVSPEVTHEIQKTLHFYLEDKLAPSKVLHGTLVDVYGIGLLFMGKSGIGKSETALDLVVRGHRLVADDLVRVKRRGHIIIGEGVAPSDILRHNMEIRGIGIVNIGLLYGIKAIRLHKRVEVIVNFVPWDEKKDYVRTGLETQSTEILGIELPLVKIPLIAGKHLSTLSELVALNHILKINGFDPAKIIDMELIKILKKEAKMVAKFEEDEE